MILEKTPIREEALAELFRGSTLNLEMRNDIYSTYRLRAPPHLNGMDPHRTNYLSIVCIHSDNLCFCHTEIKTTVVCPATEKHVKKYQRKESFLVEETEEDYKSITLPYIQKQSFSVQVGALRLAPLLQDAL